jgi:arylsulfatase A-like enzyme
MGCASIPRDRHPSLHLPALRRKAANAATKPNIILILTDDLATNLVPSMPNLLEMQKEGTSFSNYFVTNSLCCPPRSSIFTGKLPHDTAVFTNNPPDGGYAVFSAPGNPARTFAAARPHGRGFTGSERPIC